MTQQITFPCISIPLSENESSKKQFETAVTDAVDECFSTLGDSLKQAIYSKLEKSYGIRKEDIPFKIEAFTDAVELTFGEAAKLIEVQIIKNLKSKIKGFSYKTKKTDLFFVEYVQALQSYLESQV